MKRIIFLTLISCFLFISIGACDQSDQPQTDFLERANIFWANAIKNNCSLLEGIVRYPVLMDNKSIDSAEELNSRCVAIYTSAKYHKEKKGISAADSPLEIHESGWLKKEVLAGHPLFKAHVGNDTSFFLLEVTSIYFGGQPATFIFRRDYEDSNGNWDIIMFEPYSLTAIMQKK